MQNVSSDTTNNNEKIDKGSNLQELGKVSTPQSFNSSPIKSEFNPSYAEIFLSDTSDSEEDDVSEVEAFVIDQDDLADEAEMEEKYYLPNEEVEEKYYLPSEEDSEDHTVDPETQARLEALLEAAGIGKLATGDGKLADPEVLRRLTSSVSCALDEAAAALTRMRNENPRPQNERSLVQACSDGDVKTVKKLLTEGRSVHETTDEGESLLSLACSAGYYELAQVLLAMHANVEDRGIKGECTPLMEAASSGFYEIVRLLVNHGADVNGQSSSGNTPLMYACAGGHEAVVRVLLECGANPEDHNENGHTPLMEAASAGHVGVAKILLEYGAGINTHSNEFKESALTLACYKGHLDMVRFLLSAGADQEHKTDEMHTALMEASMDGHVEVAKLLLDSGAQVNMPTDSFESPLTLAACGGHVDLALLLIERGANIEEVNDEGYTPLMEAAREGHEEMVCVLLQKGAKINAHTEETQETALTLACCGGFLDVADFLLKNGANIELGASTPLMEAAQEGHLELVRYLLDAGAQVHAKTQTGDTALTYACENGHTDVADLLLSYGANLEHESEGGRTPLMKACRAGHLCTVQFLISKNADVNRQTSSNDHTPLSLACAGGHLNVVQLLLAHNADPYHKLKDNSTMLIEAAKGGHTNVVQLLLDFPRSVISGSSVSSPSDDSSSNLCSQGERELRLSPQQPEEIIQQVFEPKEQVVQTITVLAAPGGAPTPAPGPTPTPAPAQQGGGAEKVREKLQSINLQQLKLLQKEKQQLQELQTKHIDILEFKKKKQEEKQQQQQQASSTSNTGDGQAKSSRQPSSPVQQRQKPSQALPAGEKQAEPVATQPSSPSSSKPAQAQKQKHKPAQPASVMCNNTTPAQPAVKPTEDQTNAVNSTSNKLNTSTVATSTSQPQPHATNTGSTATPSIVPRPVSTAHATNTTTTATPSIVSRPVSTANTSPSQTTVPTGSPTTSSNTTTPSVLQTPATTSHTNPTPTQSTTPFSHSVVTSPTLTTNTNTTSYPSATGYSQQQQRSAFPAMCPNNKGGKTGAGFPMCPGAKGKATASRQCQANGNASATTLSCDSSAQSNQADQTSQSLTSSEVQQVKNAPQPPQSPLLGGLTAEEVLKAGVGAGGEMSPESKMSFLLQDPKCQGPLANFFQSQFFIDHVKRMRGKDSAGQNPLCPEGGGDPPSPPSPPNTPPPLPAGLESSCHRPLTPPLPPPNYFNVDPSSSASPSPPRPAPASAGVTQGLVVGTQPLFHPGANTTVLHNTIYTRSSATVPSPADVNQSTAICDRPKAKPVSKKEGKNGKKHHQLAAYHFAVQQQKEALQLKQLVEMNEQLVSQVVSQQKQLVLNHNSTTGLSEGGDGAVPPPTLLSNDILADSMARSKLLASTAKEMMESMSVKVDMDQETRDLIDQLETITMEEVERAASQGQKKLLQDKLQDYAAGLQDGLKMAASSGSVDAASAQARFQQVGVNFVGSSGGAQGVGVEDAYQYFTVPSPGGPVQVQQYPNGFQLQYQVSRQEISQYSKVDGTSSPFPSPNMSPKIGSPGCDNSPSQSPPGVSPPVSCTTQVQATQTPTPVGVEVPPPSVKKAMQSVTSTVAASSSGKSKKREAQGRPAGPASLCHPPHPPNGSIDPTQSRFPVDTPSPAGSVTTSTSYSGMDVDSETESNHDTALTLACAGGHEELVELLLSRGADIEHRDKKGFTPLILAATAGHDKVVDILLNHVADMEAQSERTKDTPLSLACSGGRYEVVELLLTRGANKEHRNVSDYTPLSLAASGGYVNIIKLLLTHGAEINSRTGSKLGISPLMLAAMNGHTAAVKLLLDMGSDINAQIETNRNTALTLACFQGRHEVVSLLLDRKANVEHRAKTGLTPLMEAASGGYVEVGRVLLDKGADVNAPPVPSSRDTALTIAADKGHCRFVELLLSKGAQVEVKNKKGNSPLWLAANGGHLSVVELLCKHGADIDSQDNRKVSCLMAAFRKGHVKAVRWMVNHVAQFPSDQEMTRYIQTVNDKELLDKCQECSMVIRVAKNQQAEKANKNANILLEELDMEKWREESKRAAQARKRERKKQKKLEKKEVKRKALEEEEEDDDEEETVGRGGGGRGRTSVEDELGEDENDIETSAGRGEGEEGDSGIDANSQASCSSNEVKTIGTSSSSSSRKKKKTKSASTPNVPAKQQQSSSKTSNGSSSQLQKNASTGAVPSSNKQSEPKTSSNKTSSEPSSKKEKKKQQQQNQSVAQQQQHNSTTAQQQSKDSVTKSATAASSVKEISSKSKKTSTATSSQPSQPAVPPTLAPPAVGEGKMEPGAPSGAPVAGAAVNNKEKKTKEKVGVVKVVTPRKEPQALVFESTRHPAEREDFEATGNEPFKERTNKTRTSLMSLYSDGELIASSSGVKISPTSKQQAGRREEGWKEVVRKYLNTTFRHKKVSVPLNAISRVIGRGGSNINAIRSATSAHIEVEKQCKGQGERIITIKGNNEAIKQAHSLINTLIRDPEVDLLKLLSETSKTPSPPTPAPPVPAKSKPAAPQGPPSAPSSTVPAPSKAGTSGPASAGASSAPPPPLLGSMTFVKAPSHPTAAPATLPTPQGLSCGAPTPLIPGLRASAPRPAVPRLAGDGVLNVKRSGALPRPPPPSSSAPAVPPSSTAVTPSASVAPVSSSFAAKLSEPPSPPPQVRPLPTASAPPTMSSQESLALPQGASVMPPVSVVVGPPCISAPPSYHARSSGASPTPPPPAVPLPSPQPSGLTEYSLFNDTFTKVTQQSVWGREDEDKTGNMNFASVAANSNGNVGNSCSVANENMPAPPLAEPSLAPGYRGTTAVSSPVMCKMTSAASPSMYHQPRPNSLYIEDPSPLYQQDLLKMVPGPSYIPTTVSMSRLNPRAPDFSSVKTQAPLFNASVAPPTHIPPPVVGFPTRWPYPGPGINYPQQDMMSQMSQFASLALAQGHNQAGDLFSTTMENTPPTSPPQDERKVPPRPIGTERAWKQYNNVIGNTPLEETAPWLQQQDNKNFGGIGDNRHMFRSSAVPQYSRIPLPEDLVPPLPPTLDNYNMNGGATLMLLPQQQSYGLTSLLTTENSWDPASTRLCMSDVPPLAEKPQPPHVGMWTKWTN
uniref:Ankyrin repeat and KH domain-containing protein 1 n=1 Tax=Cacopsylla melanoneura TaxID=428564 RepID=A0A8D8UUR8_9HEMI